MTTLIDFAIVRAFLRGLQSTLAPVLFLVLELWSWSNLRVTLGREAGAAAARARRLSAAGWPGVGALWNGPKRPLNETYLAIKC
jgi:hypothetical protein